MIRLYSVVALLAAGCAVPASAQTFFYVGAPGGDFFNEANWNDAADGTGNALAGDPLMDDTGNAIALDLVIDGISVEAAGQVDFGTGSLSLLGGADFSVTGAGHDLDINPDSGFVLDNATLEIADSVFFEGTMSFTNGAVTAADNIDFADNTPSLTVNGTVFSTIGEAPGAGGSNITFDTDVGVIANAIINADDRLGIRNTSADPTSNVVLVDTVITINGVDNVAGDVDDVFSTNDANGAILTLEGASTLFADQIDDGVALELDGTSVATINATDGAVDAANGGTITLLSTSAVLDIVNESSVDVRSALINGLTGLSFTDDPSGWTVPSWDGVDAVTLQIVPEPTSALLLITVSAFSLRRRFNR